MYMMYMNECQQQCSALIREKDAVHTIMEQKIKVLVSSIAQAVDLIVRGPLGQATSGPIHALTKVRRVHDMFCYCSDCLMC